MVDSQSFGNLSYDDYTSSKVAAHDGLVQEEEFDTISGLVPRPAATARLILANKTGDSLHQDDMPPYVRGDANRDLDSGIVFTTEGAGVSDLLAAHELGHLLGLSIVRPPDPHDPGPFPAATSSTFGGLMHAGEGTDQPGLWLGHDDWKKANETARRFSP